jgi:glycine hydroxymethyltransferase
MAEGLFRDLVEKSGEEMVVASAGIGAMEGMRPSSHAVAAMAEENIDISEQRSQMITPPMIEEFTHIFGMTRGHIEVIRSYFPESLEKTFILREFLCDTDLDLDVPDPIGEDLDEYRRCRNLIKEAMPGILKFVACGVLDL